MQRTLNDLKISGTRKVRWKLFDQVVSLTRLAAPGDPICAFGAKGCDRPVEFRGKVASRIFKNSITRKEATRFYCAFHASWIAQANKLVVNG